MHWRYYGTFNGSYNNVGFGIWRRHAWHGGICWARKGSYEYETGCACDCCGCVYIDKRTGHDRVDYEHNRHSFEWVRRIWYVVWGDPMSLKPGRRHDHGRAVSRRIKPNWS